MRRRGSTLALAALVAAALSAPAADADSTLTLSLGPAPALGSFVPGLAADYDATTTASVSSGGANATLTVVDSTGLGLPGHLLAGDGAASLAEPLEVGAGSSAPGATGFAPAAIGASPLVILTYGQPVLDDPVTIAMRQPIDANEPLRSGDYAKTLTFTLSTTSP